MTKDNKHTDNRGVGYDTSKEINKNFSNLL